MQKSPLLQIKDVGIAFNGRSIFGGLTHAFDVGCHAILGPNGVGKSTLLGAAAGAIPLDAGCIRVAGYDLAQAAVPARKSMAFVPDNGMFYPFLSGAEFISVVLTSHGLAPRLQSSGYSDLVTQMNAGEHVSATLREMSLGTRKKFFLIAALLIDPPVLILDEPFNALDQLTATRLVELLKQRSTDRLVLLSSHQQNFVEQLGATPWHLVQPPHNRLHPGIP